MKPNLILNHLRRIRSYPFEGELRFRAIMIDIKCLETKLNIRILPPCCDNSTKIRVFTRLEADKELEINKNARFKQN